MKSSIMEKAGDVKGVAGEAKGRWAVDAPTALNTASIVSMDTTGTGTSGEEEGDLESGLLNMVK
jgi:hypothetical protein